MSLIVVVTLLWLVLFAATLLGVSVGLKYLETQRRGKVTGMFRAVSSQTESGDTVILKESEGRSLESLQARLKNTPVVRQLSALIEQAGLDWSPLRVPVMMFLGAVAGLFLASFIHVPVFRQFAMLAFALGLGMAPLLYLWVVRQKRLAKFEEQFPEGLDFLARSMRAGHAFSVSIEMLAEESLDPLGMQFRRVFHEQNLGAPMETALRNLTTRVPILDVKFFVAAVLMQRDTGGNLAEILTKLSYVIRERFRLKGQVRAVSAHGRITALVLTILPLATTLALTLVAPTYLESMARDPDGRYLIVGAIAGQFLGYFFMRRIIDIKV
ncbi:MAG: type II secretion system F family protein [Acidobacteria bacterium]|nr:type II secretion system F family protein [Acidobacteriota bacterium]